MSSSTKIRSKDRVVCVNDTFDLNVLDRALNWIKEGTVYTIREVVKFNGKEGVYLEEVENPIQWFDSVGGFMEPAFSIKRFKKKMTDQTKIAHIENTIRKIFAKDIITDADIKMANKYIEVWKKLKNYKS